MEKDHLTLTYTLRDSLQCLSLTSTLQDRIAKDLIAMFELDIKVKKKN